jgi:predicted MFS family arabinose efflux permease
MFSSGETGTFLALSIGLGGGVGTFLGGYIADKLASRNEGWRAWIVCFAVLIYIPASILSFSALDSTSAMYWFLGPAIFGSFHVGIIFAVLQSEAPVEMRSVVAAINLFILNIIGMGLGPLMVGIVSDYMEPSVGIDGLRYGLLATTIFPIWGSFHMWRGGVLLSRK